MQLCSYSIDIFLRTCLLNIDIVLLSFFRSERLLEEAILTDLSSVNHFLLNQCFGIKTSAMFWDDLLSVVSYS